MNQSSPICVYICDLIQIMSKNITLFITYNPNNGDEQTLAVRLHTIGVANGLRMFLPDRFNSKRVLDIETKRRIDESDYFVLFSFTSKLSPIIDSEISYAWERFKDKSKIIIIYNARESKSLKSVSDNCTEIYFDPNTENIELVIHKIMTAVSRKEEKPKRTKELQEALLALLGIGLGLVVLNELSKE